MKPNRKSELRETINAFLPPSHDDPTSAAITTPNSPDVPAALRPKRRLPFGMSQATRDRVREIREQAQRDLLQALGDRPSRDVLLQYTTELKDGNDVLPELLDKIADGARRILKAVDSSTTQLRHARGYLDTLKARREVQAAEVATLGQRPDHCDDADASRMNEAVPGSGGHVKAVADTSPGLSTRPHQPHAAPRDEVSA